MTLQSESVDFLIVLEEQSHRGTVAHLAGTEVLDRTGVLVEGVESEGLAHGSVLEVGTALEVDEGLLDNRLHLALAALHVHHHGDRNTTCDPLLAGLGQVAHARHVAGNAGVDQHGGVVSEGVSIVGVEVGRIGAAAFITEEVVLSGKFAYILAILGHLLETVGNHLAEQTFCLDERNLYVAVAVAVEAELKGDLLGQTAILLGVGCGEKGLDLRELLVLREGSDLVLMSLDYIVELGDQALHRGDELDQTLGDKHGTEVPAHLGALTDYVADVVYDIVESHLLGLNFLGDETDVGLSLESAFQGDVAGAAAHQLDEVVIFLGRVTVTLDVADYLAVDLAGGVETERSLDPLVLQVTVDGLGHTDNLHVGSDVLVVLGEHGGVGVGVVTADDNERLDVEFLQDLETGIELLWLLELGTARTDDVETAGVTEILDDACGKLHVLVIDESGRAHEESIEAVFLIQLLKTVENTADHIVTAGGLAAGQDDTYVERLFYAGRILVMLEFNDWHTIGMGEQILDFLLIGN